MTEQEGADATMDAFGEAFMKMVRERLKLQVYPNGNKVNITLMDVSPHQTTFISSVTISINSPAATLGCG